MKKTTLSRTVFFVTAMSFSALSTAEPVWIDVRTAVEHRIDRIEGDTRISYGDIVQEVTEIFPDKETDIHLYCRSGGRADKAMHSLQEAGYTNVSNAGGIDDARTERNLDE